MGFHSLGCLGWCRTPFYHTLEIRKAGLHVWCLDLFCQDVFLVQEKYDRGLGEPLRVDGIVEQWQALFYAALRSERAKRKSLQHMFITQMFSLCLCIGSRKCHIKKKEGTDKDTIKLTSPLFSSRRWSYSLREAKNMTQSKSS